MASGAFSVALRIEQIGKSGGTRMNKLYLSLFIVLIALSSLVSAAPLGIIYFEDKPPDILEEIMPPDSPKPGGYFTAEVFTEVIDQGPSKSPQRERKHIPISDVVSMTVAPQTVSREVSIITITKDGRQYQGNLIGFYYNYKEGNGNYHIYDWKYRTPSNEIKNGTSNDVVRIRKIILANSPAMRAEIDKEILAFTVAEKQQQRAHQKAVRTVGTTVCKLGRSRCGPTEIRGFVENISEDRIQIRIANIGNATCSIEGMSYKNVPLRQGTILWDNASEWEDLCR